MNILDHLIGAVSPKAALEREAARLHLEHIRQTRNYQAAKTGRRTDGWNNATGSANAALAGGGYAILRARTRDAVRNNGYAASAIRKLTSKIVGQGISPNFVTNRDRVRKRLEELWTEFNENCDPEGQQDYLGMQSLQVRSTIEGGDSLALWSWDKTEKMPLKIKLLEGDFLDHSLVKQNGNNRIMQGVEFNTKGQRVGYYLYPTHPGEIMTSWGAVKPSFVPAQDVDHMFDILRIGQVRGVPWFAPVLMKINDSADYDDAELVRKKIEACFSVFVTRGSGALGSPLAASQTDELGRRIEGLSPGMVSYLAPGDDVKFGMPSQNQGFADYMIDINHAISAGVGIPYFMMTGRLDGVNYSSARIGMIDFWDLLDHWQLHMVIPQNCRKVMKRFLLLATLRGIPLPPDLKVEWITPARPLVDPLKDITATKESMKAGLLTFSQANRERGNDPSQQMAELAREQALRVQMGVHLDIDQPPASSPVPAVPVQDSEDPTNDPTLGGKNDQPSV